MLPNMIEDVLYCVLIYCYATCNSYYCSEWRKIFILVCKREQDKERREIFYIKREYKSPLKNGSVPRDMLVLSVMTLSADLLRQIVTDPHGFSRAHSIGNGLFNFPQGALPFPRNASLKRHALLGFASHTKISTKYCITRVITLKF